jgi:hypothetical protein
LAAADITVVAGATGKNLTRRRPTERTRLQRINRNCVI